MVTILIDLSEDIDKKIRIISAERGISAKSITIVKLLEEYLAKEELGVFFGK